tara:strand:- start:301 stop:693 length:393 start_codon:yes stop_codon:yes gene_type:complete
MTKFDRPSLRILRSDLEELLATFNTDKHNITFDLGGCTYSDGEATFKLKVVKNGAKTRKQEDTERFASLEGLDLTKIANLSGDDYSLTEFRPKASKRPWLITKLKTGQLFTIDTETAKRHFSIKPNVFST